MILNFGWWNIFCPVLRQNYPNLKPQILSYCTICQIHCISYLFEVCWQIHHCLMCCIICDFTRGYNFHIKELLLFVIWWFTKPAVWRQVVVMFPVPCPTSADLWAPNMKVGFHLVPLPQAAGALSMIAAKVLEALVLSGQEVPAPTMRVWPPLQHIFSLNPLWQRVTSTSGHMAISHWSSVPKVLYLSVAQSGASVLMDNQLRKLPNTEDVWSSRQSTDHGLHLVVNGKF